MNTLEISEAMTGLKKFAGVFAKDQLPAIVKNKPIFYIVNTDPIASPGEHWIAMYIGDEVEFFDSLGRNPNYYGERLEYFLINNGYTNDYNYSCERIQNYESIACGQFCIYYCLLRNMKYTFSEIMNHFNYEDLSMNDDIVTNFYNKIISN
jgi:hypothetical protein